VKLLQTYCACEVNASCAGHTVVRPVPRLISDTFVIPPGLLFMTRQADPAQASWDRCRTRPSILLKTPVQAALAAAFSACSASWLVYWSAL
jgi:hypothetical protein